MDEHAKLTALLADQDVHCPGCGYNLRGLKSTRCPECGQDLLGMVPEIDLRDGLIQPKDQLYEIAAMGSAFPMVGLGCTSVVTLVMWLPALFGDGVPQSQHNIKRWYMVFMMQVCVSFLFSVQHQHLIASEEAFGALPRRSRITRSFLAWWWFWGLLVVAPFGYVDG